MQAVKTGRFDPKTMTLTECPINAEIHCTDCDLWFKIDPQLLFSGPVDCSNCKKPVNF